MFISIESHGPMLPVIVSLNSAVSFSVLHAPPRTGVVETAEIGELANRLNTSSLLLEEIDV